MIATTKELKLKPDTPTPNIASPRKPPTIDPIIPKIIEPIIPPFPEGDIIFAILPAMNPKIIQKISISICHFFLKKSVSNQHSIYLYVEIANKLNKYI